MIWSGSYKPGLTCTRYSENSKPTVHTSTSIVYVKDNPQPNLVSHGPETSSSSHYLGRRQREKEEEGDHIIGQSHGNPIILSQVG